MVTRRGSWEDRERRGNWTESTNFQLQDQYKGCNVQQDNYS